MKRRVNVSWLAVLLVITLAAPAQALEARPEGGARPATRVAQQAVDPPAPGPSPRERTAAAVLRRSLPAQRERLVVHLAGSAARARVLRLAGTAHYSSAVQAPSMATSRGRTLVLDVPTGEVAKVRRSLAARADVRSVVTAQRMDRYLVPNDAGYASQSTYLDAIKAPVAWDSTQGDPAVKIAVLDSGADLTHPDLVGKVVGTYNSVTGGTDVTDTVGHGTAVASIAAATTNDGFGVAGTGYNSSLLVVKVEDAAGEILGDAVANGVRWATDAGAAVINMSFGFSQPDVLTAKAVAYAISKGVVVVAAAGNTPTSAPNYPAAEPGVLAVGATTADGGARASFSSFGPWVDVAAPGVSILGDTIGGGVVASDGTSFAAPLVTGEVALLRALVPGARGSAVAEAVSGATGAAKLGFGQGLVDFAGAVSRLSFNTAPVFTSPPAGTSVTGTLPITMTSTATSVRVTLPGFSADVPVVNGTVTVGVPTYGRSGTIAVRAKDCMAGYCSSGARDLALAVANPAPVLTGPADGTVVSANSVSVRATASGGTVAFTLDGKRVALDPRTPKAASVDVSTLTDGAHTLSAYLCDVTGTVCDTTHRAAGRRIIIKRLHPILRPLAPSPFSPNGDTRRDTVVLTYALEQPQDVAVIVTNSRGTRVLGKRLGAAMAKGTHTWEWDGRTSTGTKAPNGAYTVSIATNRRLPTGQTLIGLSSRPLDLDTALPNVAAVVASTSTVFPVVDGYHDALDLSMTLSEPVSRVQLRIFNRKDAVVRVVASGARASGPLSLRWNGRSQAGTVLPAGAYSYQLEAVDRAGNERLTGKRAVNISRKRLVKRSATQTVGAAASLRLDVSGACSALGNPGHRGWVGSIGYYSLARCAGTTAEDDIAGAEHQLRLPAALRYGTLQIGATGGATVPGNSDRATVVYSAGTPDNPTVRSRVLVLGAADATYVGPVVLANDYLTNGRTARWGTVTIDGARYDVATYTVSWTYYVLG